MSKKEATVEEIMNLSSVEIRGWAEYFGYIADQQKRAENKARAASTRRK